MDEQENQPEMVLLDTTSEPLKPHSTESECDHTQHSQSDTGSCKSSCTVENAHRLKDWEGGDQRHNTATSNEKVEDGPSEPDTVKSVFQSISIFVGELLENMVLINTEDVLRTIQVKLKMLRLWSYQSRHQAGMLQNQPKCEAVNIKSTNYSLVNSIAVETLQNFIGSKKLIQTLLLMAGIESNPGPRHTKQSQNNNPRLGSARQEADDMSIDSGISTCTAYSRTTEPSIQIRDDLRSQSNQASVVDRVIEIQDEHNWGACRREYKYKTRIYLSVAENSNLVFKLADPHGKESTISEKLLLSKIKQSFLCSKTDRICVDICPESYESVRQKIVASIWEQAENKFGLQVFCVKATTLAHDKVSRQDNSLSELAESALTSLNEMGESELSCRDQMKKFIEHQLKYSRNSLLILEGFHGVPEIKSLKKLLSREELKPVKIVLVSKTWNHKDTGSIKVEMAIKMTGSMSVDVAKEKGLPVIITDTDVERDNADETVQLVVLNVLINIMSKQNFTVHDFREKLCMNMSKVNMVLLRNEEGLGLLHLVVFHKRVDFMEVLFDLGLWESLRNQTVSSFNQGYNGCDPFCLAEKLSYNQAKETIRRIDAWEKQMTVLQMCARQGNEKLVKEMISKYPHLVGMKTVKGATALYWACSAGSLETVRKLVSAGESALDSTDDGENLLQRAVSLGHANLVGELAHVLRLPVNVTDVNGKYLFEIAAVRGDKECFDKLMENKSTYENSALVIASAAGKIQFLKHLFSKYSVLVDVNFVDKYSKTALFRAVEKNQSEVFTFLLRKGANIKVRDRRRRNLFYIAAQEGHETIIDLLIREAATRGSLQELINQQDWFVGAELCFLVKGKDRGRQAWHYVEIQRNAYHIFKERTKGGAIDVAEYGVVLKSGWGREPPAAVVEEVDARYDERRITETTAVLDMSPLHISILKGNFSISKKLIQNGADVNLVEKFRMASLHFACMMGNLELVDLLLGKNASVTAIDGTGKNAQQVAEFNRQTDLVKHLTSSRYNTMVQHFLRESLDPAKEALKQEKLAAISTEGTDVKRYLIQKLRDLSTDINIFLFDIGSGPIQEESASSDTVHANQPSRPNTF